MTAYRCAVVGGGIVGIAVARELASRLPHAGITVFEKEDRLAAHQSGHNSGVVHAGLYYEPGSLKARLCRRGVELLRAFCSEHDIAYDECGKIVVAHDEAELARLNDIRDRAVANGVPGVELIDQGQLTEIEPAATGIAALHSPHTAIVDYAAVTKALAADLESACGKIRCGHEVRTARRLDDAVRLQIACAQGEYETEAFDLVVACAGLQSDRLASATGDAKDPRIVPFFGDYFLLRPDKRALVRGLIYPVPDPKYPFLGVHATKRIDGEVLLGPNAFLSPGRETYRKGTVNLPDLAATLGFGGVWKFAVANIPAALREVRTAASTRQFVGEAARYIPGITPSDVVAGPRGIRAQAMEADGSLVDDFVVTHMGPMTHVRNAPSPGATSSLAIAEYVVERALAGLDSR